MANSRSEYMKRYRKENAERIKELNRINYLRRKERMKQETIEAKELILKIKEEKEKRFISMSPGRKRRRERVIKSINKELQLFN